MDALRWPHFMQSPLASTVLLGLTTLVLVLWYSHRKQSYWKKIGIPYAKPYPIVGNVLEILTKPANEIEIYYYKKLGRIYGHYEGNRAVLSVADPEILRNIFVKDFHAFTGRRTMESGNKITDLMVTNIQGEDWKRVRTIITPTFTSGKIKRMMSIFNECSETLVQNFKKETENGKPIATSKLFGAFTMDVIASSAFSTKIDSHNEPNNEFVMHARLFFKNIVFKFIIFFLMPFLMNLFQTGMFSTKALNFFTKVVLQIIDERNKTGQKRNDFLQLLLDSSKELRDEGQSDVSEQQDFTENYGKDDSKEALKLSANTKKTLSHEELIAQCVIFFIAGYESVSTALSFVVYTLTIYPDVQEKVIQELDEGLRSSNGELTYDVIRNMKYLDNVISETLRLFPPPLRIERVADMDYKLGDTGIIVPKGMVITIPIYAIQRDPKNFPDPEKFDPNRFTPEERAKHIPYTYMPFGIGPRNCIGMRFALVEIKACVANILNNFRLKPCPQTKVPVELKFSAFLQPKEVTVALEVRKDSVKAS